MAYLMIIRHGDTDYTYPEQRAQGIADTMILPTAAMKAYAVGYKIGGFIEQKKLPSPDRIYISPQMRALQTFSKVLHGASAAYPYLSEDESLKVEVLPELRKTYVGPETGLLESEIKKYQKENNLGRMAAAHARLGETHAFDPRSPYMQWFLNKYNIRLNYNKDGCALPEDNKDIKKRQLQAVNEIISRVKGGKNVWIVDHGMQWLLEELISGDLPKIPTTTPYILHFDPHGYTGYEIIDTKDREIKERVLTPGLREAMSILQTDGHNVAVEHLENGLSDCSAKWIKMCSQMNYVNER